MPSLHTFPHELYPCLPESRLAETSALIILSSGYSTGESASVGTTYRTSTTGTDLELATGHARETGPGLAGGDGPWTSSARVSHLSRDAGDHLNVGAASSDTPPPIRQSERPMMGSCVRGCENPLTGVHAVDLSPSKLGTRCEWICSLCCRSDDRVIHQGSSRALTTCSCAVTPCAVLTAPNPKTSEHDVKRIFLCQACHRRYTIMLIRKSIHTCSMPRRYTRQGLLEFPMSITFHDKNYCNNPYTYYLYLVVCTTPHLANSRDRQ